MLDNAATTFIISDNNIIITIPISILTLTGAVLIFSYTISVSFFFRIANTVKRCRRSEKKNEK